MTDIYNQQFTTQSPGGISGGKVPTDNLRALDRAAADLERMGKDTYLNYLNATAATEMTKLFAENDGKPIEELEKALDDYRNGIAGTISDPNVAIDFLSNYDLKKAGYMGRAIQNNILLSRKELKQSSFDNFTTSVQDMGDSARAVFLTAGDDEDIFVDYQNNRDLANGVRATTQDNGINTFSNAERQSMAKQMSAASVNSLRDVLGSEDTDPITKETLINKIANNDPVIKSMFDPKDWATIQRMGAGAAGKSAKDALRTMTALEYERILSGMKEKSDDKDYSGGTMNDMLALRAKMSEDFEKGNLSGTDYKKFMGDTSVATLNKVREYGNSINLWTSRPMQNGIKKINGEIAGMDLTPDQQLYIYESFMREYAIAGGTEARNDDNRTIADQTADKVIQNLVKEQNPNWNSARASGIVMGRTIYRTPGSVSSPIGTNNYQIMQDKDGKKYKVYYDKNGQLSEDSIKQEII
jgi:hypothetical protein